jgi:squalene-hopene/tetraprenyl-beta-curcumene cyclase
MLRTSALLATLLLLAPAAAAQSSEELKNECDAAIRWLRGQQDAETGAYGGVAHTGWVLWALAASPRAYEPGDGPFVSRAVAYLESRRRASGAIAEEGASGVEALAQTRLAALALSALPAGTASEALAGAIAFLGASGEEAPEELEALQRELPGEGQARELAQSVLAERGEDGTWSGAEGPVVATSRAVVELSRAHRALKQVERAAAQPPVETTALPPFAPADRDRALAALTRGTRFLLESRGEHGLWGAPDFPDAGLTAMALTGLLAHPEPRPDFVEMAIQGGLDWLCSLQHEDGSIHDGKLANYITSASVMALAAGNREGDREAIARARDFLRALQADEGEGYSEGDRYYGGIGYGGDERPDLSNLNMALDALRAAGVAPDDPAFQKAVKFLQRTQNRSESNDVTLVSGDATIVPGNDGGAGYMPGDSKAGFVELPDGTKVPRSYGSMTYALLKGYVFAGLSKTDPRVQAAWEWLQRNYTLDVNPGFEASKNPLAPYQGLFYYLHTMARCLDVFGEEVLVDGAGLEHSWRVELCGRLVSMQRQDGSWLNANSPRWYEGNPVLATSYALEALRAALPAEQ